MNHKSYRSIVFILLLALPLLVGCAESAATPAPDRNLVLGPPDTVMPAATASPTVPATFSSPTALAPTTPPPLIAPRATNTRTPLTSTLPAAPDPVVLAAGDIAVCGTQQDEATAKILLNTPGTVLAVGDEAYPSGTASQFANCYGPSWGRVKARTYPVPGNHEYVTAGAAGYFGYFGATAGAVANGYYSFDLGAWHLVALNSEIPGYAGSPQEKWLRADLAAHPAACTLAYWHQPRFSSGPHGSNDHFQPLWQALYDAGADIVLNGHDHDYERFAPQAPDGAPDPEHGIREFVAGTGGATLYPPILIAPNSELRNNTNWGVLKLTLHPATYDWQFLSIYGKPVDSGSGSCH